MDLLDPLATAAGLVATVLAFVRWLRVAQREGWKPFAASSWAVRWWTLPASAPLGVVALGSIAATPVVRPAGLVGAAALAVGPLGLRLRGHRPGPLRWTPATRRVGLVAVTSVLVLVAAARLLGSAPAAVVALVLAALAPVLVDLSSLATVGPDPTEGVVPSGPSADAVLAELDQALPTTRRVLVTGGPYGAAGRALGERAAATATHVLIVGRHAREDLQRGVAAGPPGCTVVLCHDVDHATAWVETETDPSDTVRWVHVQPDHIP